MNRYNEDQKALHGMARTAKRTGLSEEDGWTMFSWAQEYDGFRYHQPGRDRYKGGALHIVIFGIHISLF